MSAEDSDVITDNIQSTLCKYHIIRSTRPAAVDEIKQDASLTERDNRLAHYIRYFGVSGYFWAI